MEEQVLSDNYSSPRRCLTAVRRLLKKETIFAQKFIMAIWRLLAASSLVLAG
jgi:hypothetical protein